MKIPQIIKWFTSEECKAIDDDADYHTTPAFWKNTEFHNADIQMAKDTDIFPFRQEDTVDIDEDYSATETDTSQGKKMNNHSIEPRLILNILTNSSTVRFCKC